MRLSLSVVGALIGAALLPVSATATPLAAMPKNFMSQPAFDSLAGDNSLIAPVQYRRGHYRGRSYHRGGGDGAGIAAGILGGLLLGAIIANQAQQNRTVEYCVQRFRSYDPYSRTYLGYDGRRHSCP